MMTLLAQAAPTTWPDVAFAAVFAVFIGFVCWVMFR